MRLLIQLKGYSLVPHPPSTHTYKMIHLFARPFKSNNDSQSRLSDFYSTVSSNVYLAYSPLFSQPCALEQSDGARKVSCYTASLKLILIVQKLHLILIHTHQDDSLPLCECRPPMTHFFDSLSLCMASGVDRQEF